MMERHKTDSGKLMEDYDSVQFLFANVERLVQLSWRVEEYVYLIVRHLLTRRSKIFYSTYHCHLNNR